MGLGKSDYKKFANILADGTLRVQTEESNPDAVKREYELRDKTKIVKFELVYNFLSGIITNIQIFDGQYGKNLQITIDGIVLSMNMASNMASYFAEDIMKKMPNVDLNKEVKFTPYSFEDNNKKLRRGVSIIQNNVKIQNFFYNPETKENYNGFPVLPEGWKKFSSDDWKVYFMTTRKFLQQYLEENIIPKLIDENAEQENGNVAATVSEDGEINVEDIPFDYPVSTSAPTEATQPVSGEWKTTQKPAPTTSVTGDIGQITPTPPTPTTPTPATPTTTQPPLSETPVVEDAGGVEIAIANLAKTKLGVEKDEDVQRIVMESLGLAYIQSNFTVILEKLQAMPIK